MGRFGDYLSQAGAKKISGDFIKLMVSLFLAYLTVFFAFALLITALGLEGYRYDTELHFGSLVSIVPGYALFRWVYRKGFSVKQYLAIGLVYFNLLFMLAKALTH